MVATANTGGALAGERGSNWRQAAATGNVATALASKLN